MEKIPKKVKCIKSVTNSYTEGLEYPVTNKGFVIDNFNDSFLTKWNKGKGINDNQNSSFEPIWEEEYVANPMPKGACEIRVAKDIPKRTGGSSTPFIPKGSITWVLGVDTKNTYIERIKRQEGKYIHPEGNRYCSNIPAEYFELIEGFDYGDEEFVLPEKWCVRECKEVVEWSSKKFCHTNYVNLKSEFLHIGDDLIKEYIFDNKIREGYTEITFEQFKKYVLKKDVEEPKQESKELTKYDLVEGEVYCEEWEYDSKKGIAIYKHTGKLHQEDCIYPHLKEFNRCNSPDTTTSTISKATKQQKEHLEQCIAAGKYVEYEEKRVKEYGWYVNVTKENRKTLEAWKVKQPFKNLIGDRIAVAENGAGLVGSDLDKKGRKEITTEQFYEKIGHVPEKKEAEEFAVSLKEPECEFKVGDWVVGWHADYKDRKSKPWRIEGIKLENNTKIKAYLIPEGYPNHGTSTDNVRKATKEEIEKITKIEKKDECKLEIGKWYKNGHGKTIFYYNGEDRRYGFDSEGKWCDYIGKAYDYRLNLATEQEVENLLVKEAKKRGYEIGKKIKSFYGKTSALRKNQDKYSFYEDEFFYNGCYVFQRGKWATIVEEEKSVDKCEYWECVYLNDGNKTNYTKGKTYKLCKDGMLISDKGLPFATPQESNSKFKPSTKEAYDLQEHRKIVTAENNPVWEEHVVHKSKSTPKPEYDPSKYTHLKYKIGEKVMYKGKECEVISFNTGAQNNYQYVIDNHGRSNKAFEENYSHNVECNHAFASEYDLSPVEKCVGIREQIKAENIIPYPEGGYWPEEYKQEQSLKTVKATMVKVDPLF